MIGNKTLVLVCAVLAVGLFVLPSALSLFAGQHQFIGPKQVQCSKCHGAEDAELAAGGPHKDMGCMDCHQTLPGTTKHGSDPTGMTFANQTQHASISPQCIVCHPLVEGELLNESASHTEFYQGALNASLEQGGNEACIGCHTHIGVNITWKRATTLTFVADHDPATGWNITDFTAQGTNTTTTGPPY